MPSPRICTADRMHAIEEAAQVVGVVGNILDAISKSGECLTLEIVWLAEHLKRAHVQIVEALS